MLDHVRISRRADVLGVFLRAFPFYCASLSTADHFLTRLVGISLSGTRLCALCFSPPAGSGKPDHCRWALAVALDLS